MIFFSLSSNRADELSLHIHNPHYRVFFNKLTQGNKFSDNFSLYKKKKEINGNGYLSMLFCLFGQSIRHFLSVSCMPSPSLVLGIQK